MRAAGVGEAPLASFRQNYQRLMKEETGLIPESTIEPAVGLAQFIGDPALAKWDPELLARSVMIKLNGGLGTSMGLRKVKSLLSVREGVTFLDLIVRQIQSLRESSGSKVRLLLMNSFASSDDTCEWLTAHAPADLADPGEVEMMQNRVPKIDARTMRPVEWPEDPSLEWCPPGHGDLYPALVESGWLDRLLDEGVIYAFVSNSDNLGAVFDGELLSGFAAGGAPFQMEVTRRTEVDRKGGHVARRLSDGHLLLREVAQCPDEDLESFQDISRHRYFNTNSIWLRLDRLQEELERHNGVLPLPMICNEKTVDPRSKESTPVIQLEVAMGAAIECFDGARAIEVPRSRFAPVKTTSDLLAVRSDAYLIGDDGTVSLAPERDGQPPVVELDPRHRLVDALDRLGVPSLRGCRRLVVEGDLRFEPGVVVEGEVTLRAKGPGQAVVPAGAYRDDEYQFS
jgi:UDP-N-acetylglucosamine pyrophosphorylase